jgi:hypothetical protein
MRRIFSRMGCSRGSKGACTAGESAMFESCIEDEERTERAGRYCFLNGRSVRRNKVIKDVQDRREAYHQFAFNWGRNSSNRSSHFEICGANHPFSPSGQAGKLQLPKTALIKPLLSNLLRKRARTAQPTKPFCDSRFISHPTTATSIPNNHKTSSSTYTRSAIQHV